MTATTETVRTQNEQKAYELYASGFGEKAAKRNAGRVARLAVLVGQYGVENITLREVYTSDWREGKALQNSGAEILGQTRTSTTKTTYVVADCEEKASAPAPAASTPAATLAPVAAETPAATAAPAARTIAPRVNRGQIWEECPSCGTEPVCAGCGYCDTHCCCGAANSYVKGEIYGGAE